MRKVSFIIYKDTNNVPSKVAFLVLLHPKDSGVPTYDRSVRFGLDRIAALFSTSLVSSVPGDRLRSFCWCQEREDQDGHEQIHRRAWSLMYDDGKENGTKDGWRWYGLFAKTLDGVPRHLESW